MMKHAILPILMLFFVLPSSAGDNLTDSHFFLYENYFDPGHKQKRGAQLGKDRSAIELYFGSQPSLALKLNFYGAKHGALTERGYIMAGMDFDTDLYAKFGYVLNPGKRNKNKSLSATKFGWWRLWRYVMIRKAIEIGYKGHFLDGESLVSETARGENPAFYYVNEDFEESKNYGGFTANYTWIFDGNFLFDKTTWYFFDHRTARRIRLKIDAGVFLNLNQFQKPHIGILSGSNDTNGYAVNENETDEAAGEFRTMETYPVLSPFINFSLGFAF